MVNAGKIVKTNQTLMATSATSLLLMPRFSGVLFPRVVSYQCYPPGIGDFPLPSKPFRWA